VSYELDRQNGNLTFAGSTMKGGIATTIVGQADARLRQLQRGRMTREREK